MMKKQRKLLVVFCSLIFVSALMGVIFVQREAQIVSLRGQVEALKSTIEIANQAKSIALEEIDLQRAARSAADAEVARLENQRSRLLLQADLMAQEIDSFKAELAEADQLFLATQERHADEIERLAGSHRDAVSGYENVLLDLRGKIAKDEVLLGDLRAEVVANQKSLNEFKRELDDARSQLRLAVEREISTRSGFSQEIRDLNSDLQARARDLDRIKVVLNEREETILELDRIVALGPESAIRLDRVRGALLEDNIALARDLLGMRSDFSQAASRKLADAMSSRDVKLVSAILKSEPSLADAYCIRGKTPIFHLLEGLKSKTEERRDANYYRYTTLALKEKDASILWVIVSQSREWRTAVNSLGQTAAMVLCELPKVMPVNMDTVETRCFEEMAQILLPTDDESLLQSKDASGKTLLTYIAESPNTVLLD